MSETKKVFFIQSLNSFINGIIQILVPLLMIEKNVDVVTMGFVFATVPFVFQTIRVIFGSASDIIGRRVFFILNSLLNTTMLVIYSSASTVMDFLFGNLTEGVKSASLWSVNRAYLLDKSEEKRKILTKLVGASNIASAVGSISAGFLIVWLAYYNTVILCIFLSFAMLPVALSLENGGRIKMTKERIKNVFKQLDFRKKSKVFKKFAKLSLLNGLTMGIIMGYVFPLFLKENGFSTELIGLILGVNVLLVGITSILTRKTEIKKLIILGGLFFSLSVFSLGIVSGTLAGIAILLVGASRGLTQGIFEGVLSKVSDSKTYGSDVGVLTIGLHIGRSISLAASGFLIEYSGFFLLFTLGTISYVLYSSLVYREFKKLE